MDEARRFLRYITPGLVLGTITLVLLAVISPALVAMQVPKLAADGGIALLAAAVLASGGAGFLLSSMHHAIHWSWRAEVVDHSSLLLELEEARVIEMRSVQGRKVLKPTELSRRDAWIIASALWHSRLELSERIRGADPKTVVLADMMHSLGSARVAAAIAPILTLWIAASSDHFPSEAGPLVMATILWLALLALLQFSYERTGAFASRVIEIILADALMSERAKSEHPIATYVSPSPALPTTKPGPARAT